MCVAEIVNLFISYFWIRVGRWHLHSRSRYASAFLSETSVYIPFLYSIFYILFFSHSRVAAWECIPLIYMNCRRLQPTDKDSPIFGL